ncbi:MAG: penicillin acylase family protein [Opitutaceae bacterium]|nr:penicillin acylase family protein [Cephaloticoccus sp.]MCP5529072.1 penicillin acylase family protein [Opitutaceae bacterium]
MSLLQNKALRWCGIVCLGLALGGAGVTGWFYQQMRRSLPVLDGAEKLRGLGAAVKIERDAQGVPTLRGENRVDLARALGWLHAQERFFQMDLLRRRAAGELSELFGEKALAADKAARVHGFRRTASECLALLSTEERTLLEAYTAGVNAGLATLDQKPFEYLVLRTDPAAWQPEDTILTAYAMAMELNDEGNFERSLTAVRNTYGATVLEFVAPLLTRDDAALDGSRRETAPEIPSARLVNLRGVESAPTSDADDLPSPGSNSFVVAGTHTASGQPLLASDMHLSLRVPTPWYRASLVWGDHRVTGVTLPGVPIIIAGSNGHVAWGLTNAYADTHDVVVVETSAIAETLYKKGDDLLSFEKRREIIRVKGADPVEFDVNWTVWGPVIGTGENGRPLVARWTAHDPRTINLSFMRMETAQSTDEGLAVAQTAALPVQNIVLADRDGHTAWTLTGRLPKRTGYDGRLAVAWTYGDRNWERFLTPAETPTLRDPESGLIWTANNRLVGGETLEQLGDGGYAQPGRAARIRDRLEMLEQATPQDLLAIQLDEQAPVLAWWHDLLNKTVANNTELRGAKQLQTALADWDGRARADSAGYLAVRLFRQEVAALVFDALFAPCRREFAGFRWQRFQYEQSLRTLVQQQPIHFLPARFESWDGLLQSAAEIAAQKAAEAGPSWGEYNRARIIHPFSRVLPGWLTGWLNLPADPQAGDSITPRVQRSDFGASERFVVTPGREAEGIFHMPGGQSGHPLSPYYRAGHDAWAKGEPTPFLPGPAEHTLTLEP